MAHDHVEATCDHQDSIGQWLLQPADERDRVFEPFYRGSTRGAAGGTGLGLAIARGFVDANHGVLSIDDAPGGGACMRLVLPAMRVESTVAS